MQIIIPELIVTSPNRNANEALVFRVVVKKEDVTDALHDAVYDAYRNGTPLAGVLTPFQQEKPEGETERLARKRQVLGALMEKYSSGEYGGALAEAGRLYDRRKITSRTELTEGQLDEEIESYRAGLNYNQ